MGRGGVTGFQPAWSVAIQVAEIMTTDRGQIPAELYATLESLWSPGEIIEIIAVISLFNYFNRFAVGLDIPPTK